MGDDLHVYVLPEARKKGFLSVALRKVILPYMFLDGREEQRVTVENKKNKRHAEKVGFVFDSDSGSGELAGVIKAKDLPAVKFKVNKLASYTQKEFDSTISRIRQLKSELNVLREQCSLVLDEIKLESIDKAWDALDILYLDYTDSPRLKGLKDQM